LPTELATWQTFESDGLRITAVPVGHYGWRYGVDRGWMTTSYTGYLIEYQGQRVYFGGDGSYVPEAFRETRRRFEPIDLALIPIAPVAPRDFMCRAHLDPDRALDAFRLLGAKTLVPIHFDTFINSFDELGDATRLLAHGVHQRRLSADRVVVLGHGERRVFAWQGAD
jgi:L-ascorbate metabolism protein UlaG (beta-lactamase superfamily)